MKRAIKSARRLALNRETIRQLEGAGLERAAGGITLSCDSLCGNCPTGACPSHLNLCPTGVYRSVNTQCITYCVPCGATQTDCIGTANCGFV